MDQRQTQQALDLRVLWAICESGLVGRDRLVEPPFPMRGDTPLDSLGTRIVVRVQQFVSSVSVIQSRDV
jgi:hypothetical protein